MPNLYIIRQFLPITADYRGKYPPLRTRSSRRFRHFRHRHPLMLAPQPLQHLVRGDLEDPGAFLFRVAQLCKVQVYLEEKVKRRCGFFLQITESNSTKTLNTLASPPKKNCMATMQFKFSIYHSNLPIGIY